MALRVAPAAPVFNGGGRGWSNPELDLPPAWKITDLDAFAGFPLVGDGYTDIVAAFESHPLYQNLSDLRFGVNSINSFGANVTAASFHTIHGSAQRPEDHPSSVEEARREPVGRPSESSGPAS